MIETLMARTIYPTCGKINAMGNKGIRPARSLRRFTAAAPAVTTPPRGRAEPVSKISVTIDSAVLRDARAAAKRSGRTLSAHISEALERDLRRQRMAELVSEFEAEHGVISAAEVARAIASWQV
jgi:hypothetical protein